MMKSTGAGWHYRIHLHVKWGLSPHTALYLCLFAERCPEQVQKLIFSDFAWTLWPRWPQERLVKTRVVSGFIFLRLLCPAILNPRQVWKKYYFYDRLPWDQKTNLDTSLKILLWKHSLQFWTIVEPVQPPAMWHYHNIIDVRVLSICLQFGLLSEPVPPPAMRSLVMIAKCLQVQEDDTFFKAETCIIEPF